MVALAGCSSQVFGMLTLNPEKVRHPNTWTRAREEILKTRSEGLCADRVIQYADAQQLPYLQACIKEGLRIHSPVPSMYLPNWLPPEYLLPFFFSFPLSSSSSSSSPKRVR